MIFDHNAASPSDDRHAVREVLLQEPLDEQHMLDLVRRQPDSFGFKFMFTYQSRSGNQKKQDITVFPLSRLLCLHPKLEVVKAVYDAYPSAIFSKDQDKRSPLHYACAFGASREVIDFLLECCGTANIKDSTKYRFLPIHKDSTKYRFLPIHYAAAYHPDVRVLEKLITTCPASIKFRTREGALPIHYACRRDAGRPEKIQLLLEKYPEGIKVRNKNGFLPLHSACLGTPRIETLRLLIQAYPDAIRTQSKWKECPLHVACHEHASVDVVKFLIQVYPEATMAKQNRGRTPLQEAVASAAPSEVVEFLQRLDWNSHWNWDWEEFLAATEGERKKLLDDIDDRCTTAESGAAETGTAVYFDHSSASRSDLRGRFREELCKQEIDEEAILQLIKKTPKLCTYQYSFPPSESSKSREELKLHPLSQVCRKGPSLDLVEAIYNANPNAIMSKDKHGCCSLHFACMYASSEIVYFLLSTYPDAVRLATSEGLLPIHYACLSGQELGVVQNLVAIFPESVKHSTRRLDLPLHDSCRWKHTPGLVDYLLSCYPEAAAHRTVSELIPLHIACRNQRSLSEVQSLVKAFPKGVRYWNRQAEIPLHFACGNGASVDVVRYLLEMYPEGVQCKTNRKLTALDIGKENGASAEVLFLLEKVKENLSHLAVLDIEERREKIGGWLQDILNNPSDTADEVGVPNSLQLPSEATDNSGSRDQRASSLKNEYQANVAAASEEELFKTTSTNAQLEQIGVDIDNRPTPGAVPVRGPGFADSDSSLPEEVENLAEEPPLRPQSLVATVTPVAAELAPNMLELEAELEDYRRRYRSELIVEADEVVPVRRSINRPLPMNSNCCHIL